MIELNEGDTKMKLSHVQWASAHDWFIGFSRTNDGNYTVTAYDSMDGEMVEFTDYQELRDWAGY